MLELRLFEASPAWTIEGDTLVTYDLAFTRGLSLQGLDASCETQEALSDLSARIADLLCRILEGATIRFVSMEINDYSELLDAYASRFAPHSLGAYIARKKLQQCTSLLTPQRREVFCFVSTPPLTPFNGYNPGFLGRRAGKLLERAYEIHHEQQTQVARLVSMVATGLDALGIPSRHLSGDELFSVAWRMANPLLSSRIAPPQYNPEYSLRSQLFASGLENRLDFYVREGALNRVITLKLLPRHVQPTQALYLQSLPFRHQVVVTLKRVSDVEAVARMEKNRSSGYELNSLLSKIRGADRNAENPDHALLEQRRDANAVLEALNAGDKLYDLSAHVWFAGSDLEELHRNTETVLTRFRACGQADAAIEELRGRFAYLSMLPGHQSLLGDRCHALLASRAADLLPIYQAYSGSPDPVALVTTRTGELVGFQPFDPSLRAWNATIAGGTGSGKSFATRTLLTGWLSTGGRTIIATRGRDYHRFADVHQGDVFDISLEDPNLALGPFPTPIDLIQSKSAASLLQHLTSIIGIMVTEPGAGLDRIARRLLHSATRTLYENLDVNDKAPTFRDWLAALQALDEPDLQPLVHSIASQMRFWIEGPYGPAFLRNRSEHRLDSLFSVWNLEFIGDNDTMSVVLGLLSGSIAQSIQAGSTIVVMDEVWSFLSSEAGADLVETLYRTVRKEGSSIWTISQSINDYAALAERCRSAILSNSRMKLLLAHESSDWDIVVETFKLNAREAELLASLASVPGRYSEILAFFGSRRQVMRLCPTGIEYWLATSHDKDRDFEAMAIAKHPDLSRVEIIKRLARRYPHGAVHLEFDAA